MKRVILLADDSPTIQRLVPQVFADVDFDVVSVSNGDAAVRKFEEVRPDIVLADIYMPGKNGYEVCEHIRKHAELGKTPVILLAGAFDVFDADTARQIGASAHITKPFEPQALVNLVMSLAEERAAGDQGKEPQVAPPAPASESTPAPEIHTGIPMKVETEPEMAPPAAMAAAAAAPAPVYQLETQATPTVESEPPSRAASAMAVSAMAVSEPAVIATPVAENPAPAPVAPTTTSDSGDVLGLNDIFKPVSAGSVSEEEIERIANRVIQKLSTQVIESVAWDVVPEITTKVLRDELKRQS